MGVAGVGCGPWGSLESVSKGFTGRLVHSVRLHQHGGGAEAFCNGENVELSFQLNAKGASDQAQSAHCRNVKVINSGRNMEFTAFCLFQQHVQAARNVRSRELGCQTKQHSSFSSCV